MACNRGDPRRRGVSVARQWEMACGSTEYYEVAPLDEPVVDKLLCFLSEAFYAERRNIMLVYVTGGLGD